MARTRSQFVTIRTEGGLLPVAVLERIARADPLLPGLTTDSYHLARGERFGEVINRSWLRLLGAWAGLRDAIAGLADNDPATSVTRERWLLILFQELGYGRLQAAKTVTVEGQHFPVSHEWATVPIHLVGTGVRLNTRTAGVAGAARSSPHSLVQDLLNRSPERLWGIVSNGLLLRVLRDNAALTRQAYVEFDLEAMMDGEVFSDFTLLWLLAHQSRVEADEPEGCWLEQWSGEARRQGSRALEHLSEGVEAAVEALGSGFLAHADNAALRDGLRSGALRSKHLYRQLLRQVYRILFVLVAEERNLLLRPDSTASQQATYEQYYSVKRVRELAERRRGTRHSDLWQQICVVVDRLGSADGYDDLGLPALGSFLFSPEATPQLNGCRLANDDLLTAMRALSGRSDERAGYRWRFDYRNLGSEELGSVYETLLDLHPEADVAAGRFTLSAGGAERRSTGSHYTPTPILKRVLDFALEPAVAQASRAADPEQALLDLRVLDCAVGSGHFLIAAAHRIAQALASVRTKETSPPPDAVREALRDVVARCLYGVDLNPMAVELCRVALWLETLDPGKPLSFLDHHIRVGNSLLGVPVGATVARNRAAVDAQRQRLEERITELTQTLRAVPAADPDHARMTKELAGCRKELAACVYDSWADAVPDIAFKPVAADDRPLARKAMAANKKQRRSGQLVLSTTLVELPEDLVELLDRLGAGAEDSVAEVTIRAEEFEGAQRRAEYRHLLAQADTWTSAFFWPLTPGSPPPPTQELFASLKASAEALPDGTAQRVAELAQDRRFFHFELAWPEVFTEDRGGFDVILGNPPYLGGPSISGTFGDKVLHFFKTQHPAQTGGRVDLAAYFLRRTFDLLRPTGDLGLITTNSIAEGDTLRAGLEVIVNDFGGEIVDAMRSMPWEGTANVSVAVLHLCHGPYTGPRTVDGQAVPSIAPSLTATSADTEPLNANAELIAKGSNPLGRGFQLTEQAAARLLAADTRNADVVRGLLGADDITSQTDPSQPRRWIIDFGGRTEQEAAEFAEPFAVVVDKVRPERLARNADGDFKVKRAAYRDRWWQLAERSARLYERIGDLGSVIVIPEVSKTMTPVKVSTGVVFLQTLFVVASDDDALYGALLSSHHWLWAAMPEHATSLESRPRYHQTRCFETFPRPPANDAVRTAAAALHGHRCSVMRERDEGITKTYNRVIDVAETSADIAALRRLHCELDAAVAQAYGWDDLVLDYGICEHHRFGPRWLPAPEIQRDIETRLLELNRDAAAGDRRSEGA